MLCSKLACYFMCPECKGVRKHTHVVKVKNKHHIWACEDCGHNHEINAAKKWEVKKKNEELEMS